MSNSNTKLDKLLKKGDALCRKGEMYTDAAYHGTYSFTAELHEEKVVLLVVKNF